VLGEVPQHAGCGIIGRLRVRERPQQPHAPLATDGANRRACWGVLERDRGGLPVVAAVGERPGQVKIPEPQIERPRRQVGAFLLFFEIMGDRDRGSVQRLKP